MPMLMIGNVAHPLFEIYNYDLHIDTYPDVVKPLQETSIDTDILETTLFISF